MPEGGRRKWEERTKEKEKKQNMNAEKEVMKQVYERKIKKTGWKHSEKRRNGVY